MWWFFGFLLLFELLADVFAKEYALKAGAIRWTAAITGYILANAFWLTSMRKGVELSRGAVLFGISQAMFGCVLGVLVYKEQLSRSQLIGLLVGVISIVLLVRE